MLIDLDGTLCLHAEGRDPYDVSQCGSDVLSPQVVQLADWARRDGWGIVLASGRGYHEKDRWYTEQHLLWCGFGYDQLSMRSFRDPRPDHVVKEELYWQEIEPRWDVKMVFDDRGSVVSMWRKNLGLWVAQVDDRI